MKEPRVLTTDDIEVIAERAADKALEKVYANIGESLIKKTIWAVGSIVLVIVFWITNSEI
tara:strand:+ start:161 stop:340 length:180 start_codon:yes stop_codon:yes gene_type:complete